ncbi:MAG: hypothetical protein RLY35_962 [Bacteroidota bacterium]|jgi:hypothetical protein
MNRTKKFFVAILLGTFFINASAQIDNNKSLNVFIRCSAWCYTDYLKTEITWANFVQDQFVADVNLRISALETGSGGFEYQLIFEGNQKIKHLIDTLQFNTNAINTDNEIREKLKNYVSMGLVRYALQMDKINTLQIVSNDSLELNEMGIGSNPQEDPFNAWVFNFSVNGNSSGQDTYRSTSMGGRFSANQNKESHKIKIASYYNNNIQRYNYLGFKDKFTRENYSTDFLYARSITPHWSFGTFHSYMHSDYQNIENSFSHNVAFEYNLFDFKSSQTKQLTFSTYLGSQFNEYQDTTIYLKIKEWRPVGQFNVNGSFNQTWGSFGVGLNTQFFLDDVQQNTTSINLDLNARIYKGLSINFYGYYSLIRNQIFLPKQDASLNDVLLQQQAVATNYSYYYQIGLNYRFGSIFNNVVNTRFANEL